MKSLYLSTIIGLILSTSAHSQSDSTRYWLNLDGYAEANIRKQRQYDLYEHNIYAIGALTFNIGKGWSITGEAEFDNDSFPLPNTTPLRSFPTLPTSRSVSSPCLSDTLSRTTNPSTTSPSSCRRARIILYLIHGTNLASLSWVK